MIQLLFIWEQFSYFTAKKQSSNHQENISRHDNDWQKLSPEKQAYEWFGSVIEVVKSPNNNSNSIIVVGAPGYSNKKQTVVMKIGNGLLLIKYGPESSSHLGSSVYWDEIDSESIEVIPKECINGNNNTRFGSKIIKNDFNGDGKKDLLIAAKHSSTSSRLGGSVMINLS
ncbi:17162_t:CDS:2 [Entrophospora sp. SA101]|nr:2874_t:CDS:2 [Entrophospora sp. SA101]CAJ0639853.1 2880_t:CDS:2 [Entrophospora sp. SA101]CAJ0761412.1 17162_t:CDS:2 [Entrophospora sp. SA101]CAJ0871095.1 3892_t:CDS:2 [Entrophospora sp. SA101]CAJ0897115.1 7620_t:CDS:2 [Entrophospora sp. SA101]